MYWIISAFILAVTSLLERGVYKRVAYQFSLFVLFVIISGSYFNGIDWINYNKHYQEIYNNGFPVDFLPYEPGFVLIMYIIGSLFRINNFHVVILVITFFFVISFAKFIKNTNMRFNRSLLMLMMVLFLLPLFNDAIRQLAALTIMLPVLADLNNSSTKKIFFSCVLAATFHLSSILILPIIFLIKQGLTQHKIVKYSLYSVLLILLLSSMPFILSAIGGFLPSLIQAKLTTYVEKMSSEIKLGFFMITDIIAILMIYLLSRLKSFHTNQKLNILLSSVFYFFLLHFVFYFAPFLQRLLYYIFPLVSVCGLVVFNASNLIKLSNIVLPYLIVISIAVFYRNITNPYYTYDFYQPKFFYAELISGSFVDLPQLKKGKCDVIQQFDPNFCPE